MRRSEILNHVAIELAEARRAAEFSDRLVPCTGCWSPGLWKHKAIWRIECAIHFRTPIWRVVKTEHGERLVTGDWRPLVVGCQPYIEWCEHWVRAKDRAMAIACLVRDLKLDPRHELISHAVLYGVQPPLTGRQAAEIAAINARLRQDPEILAIAAAAAKATQTGIERRATRQMEFGGIR